MSTGARNNSKPPRLERYRVTSPLPRQVARGKLTAIVKAAEQLRADIG
jgi:hypothetical protein